MYICISIYVYTYTHTHTHTHTYILSKLIILSTYLFSRNAHLTDEKDMFMKGGRIRI